MTQKRLWFEGATYHVIVRGNRKASLFYSRLDNMTYLEMLKETLDYYKEANYSIICYCLMTNHIHLLIKTDKEPLSKFMCKLNSCYSKYFNSKYNLVGHVFQGPYSAKIIIDEAQLLENSRYIHLNPVRANMVKKPEDYEWSSYKCFIEEEENSLVNNNIIMDYFNPDRKYKAYREFVNNAVEKERAYMISNQDFRVRKRISN